MRWKGLRRSRNVEDRRDGRRRLAGGRGASLGCGGLLLLIVVALLTDTDPARLLDLLEKAPSVQVDPGPSPRTAPGTGGTGGSGGDELGDFAGAVLATTEDVWGRIFAERGRTYREPVLVLFDDSVRSACGFQSAAVGPFYCPADQRLYLDLAFFDDLHRRFGAPGDFAQAYVIAHEVGHHVQNLLGISAEVGRAQRQVSRERANALSVRLELQADCLAGVWARRVEADYDLVEPGDVEEGLAAAAAIGDDRLQRGAGRYVQPETWTHGSSEQRVRWLRRGMASGDPDACDTFDGPR